MILLLKILHTKILKKMNLKKYTIILFISILSFSSAYSQIFRDSSYLKKNDVLIINSDSIILPHKGIVPDHFRAQFAGNIGFLSIGTGYNFGSSYELTLMCGLVNEFFGDCEKNVFTVALKNNFNLAKPLYFRSKMSFVPAAGISVNWGHTHNTFNKLPPHYTEKYYFQNKIHLAPYVAGKLRYDINKKIYKYAEFYAEVGSLDVYILECFKNKYITLDKILNLDLGVSLYIK